MTRAKRCAIVPSNTAATISRSQTCSPSFTWSLSQSSRVRGLTALAAPGEDQGTQAQEQAGKGRHQRNLADAADHIILAAEQAQPVAARQTMPGIHLADLGHIVSGHPEILAAGSLHQALQLVGCRTQIGNLKGIQRATGGKG